MRAKKRSCIGCGGPLMRRYAEASSRWAVRKWCSAACRYSNPTKTVRRKPNPSLLLTGAEKVQRDRERDPKWTQKIESVFPHIANPNSEPWSHVLNRFWEDEPVVTPRGYAAYQSTGEFAGRKKKK